MRKKELIKENENLKSHLDILDKAILNKDSEHYSIKNFNKKEVEALDKLIFDRTDERIWWLLTQYREFFGINYALRLKVELKWLLSTMPCEYRNTLKEKLLKETEQLEEQITALKSDIEEITRCPYEYFKRKPKQLPNDYYSLDIKCHSWYTKLDFFDKSVDEIETSGKQVKEQLVAELNTLEQKNVYKKIIKELGL